jgi:hypothetical protein
MKMGRAQLTLFDDKTRIEHGGSLAVGRRKTARPLSTRKPIHLTLRSSRATGSWSLRRFENGIRRLSEKLAKIWEVQIYSLAVNGNHLHFVIRIGNRTYFQNFLRVLSGQIAMKVTRSAKGRPGRFWNLLAWTRISEWGKAFRALKAYVFQNELEAAGLIPHQPRKKEILRQ